MKRMTPREALYHVVLSLGPIPETSRGDNLSAAEEKLRDSVRALQNFIEYHDDSELSIPDSAEEYRHVERGDKV